MVQWIEMKREFYQAQAICRATSPVDMMCCVSVNAMHAGANQIIIAS